MIKPFCLGLAATLSLLVSLPAAAFPQASVSSNQQLFAQSIIYHSLSGFCAAKPGNKTLSSDFQTWRLANQQAIKQGREEVAVMAKEQETPMDSVVSNLVHVAEQEWGQLSSEQRQQKCQTLQAFLTQAEPTAN
ncbi:hypothetical protein SNR37_003382 [Agarivorans aestuarii]|uniref:Uncharacterized protein n=1 Tax=Agarivorans aestuarii TaxID=1563703 RepID=A0ABU7G3T3_9ALTE|nr:hypothetical protein [Agarivorans aestuarii]MEE1673955.1 hypothetical protein [Agarivorans aestuarii]